MTEKELLTEPISIITDLVKEVNKMVLLQIVLIKSLQDNM